MTFVTRPRFANRQIVQSSAERIDLSGTTNFAGVLMSKNIEIDASNPVQNNVLTFTGTKIELFDATGLYKPIGNRYMTTLLMTLDQANQLPGYIYFDGEKYYEYLGTTNGNITDYNIIGGVEAGAGLSLFNYNTVQLGDDISIIFTPATNATTYNAYLGINGDLSIYTVNSFFPDNDLSYQTYGGGYDYSINGTNAYIFQQHQAQNQNSYTVNEVNATIPSFGERNVLVRQVAEDIDMFFEVFVQRTSPSFNQQLIFGIVDGEWKAVFTDTANNKGLEYGGDYEPNFTARSLVTKQYADSLISDVGRGLSVVNNEIWVGDIPFQNGDDLLDVLYGFYDGTDTSGKILLARKEDNLTYLSGGIDSIFSVRQEFYNTVTTVQELDGELNFWSGENYNAFFVYNYKNDYIDGIDFAMVKRPAEVGLPDNYINLNVYGANSASYLYTASGIDQYASIILRSETTNDGYVIMDNTVRNDNNAVGQLPNSLFKIANGFYSTITNNSAGIRFNRFNTDNFFGRKNHDGLTNHQNDLSFLLVPDGDMFSNLMTEKVKGTGIRLLWNTLPNTVDIIVVDNSQQRGAIYAGDYEPNFVPRSLVTKQYADGIISNIYVAPPLSNTDIGVIGQRAYDQFFVYECIDTNNWVRYAYDQTIW